MHLNTSEFLVSVYVTGLLGSDVFLALPHSLIRTTNYTKLFHFIIQFHVQTNNKVLFSSIRLKALAVYYYFIRQMNNKGMIWHSYLHGVNINNKCMYFPWFRKQNKSTILLFKSV